MQYKTNKKLKSKIKVVDEKCVETLMVADPEAGEAPESGGKRNIEASRKPYILVKTRWESTVVDLDEILYLQRNLRKIDICTEEETYSFYESIDNIAPDLSDNFYQVLQGTYFNLDKIKQVKDGEAIFNSGLVLPVSEKSFSKLKRAHSAHYLIKKLHEDD